MGVSGGSERLAEAEVVIAVHGGDRRDLRRREPGEDMLEIAWLGELDEVSEHDDQVGLFLREPSEGRVGHRVEPFSRKDVDPA